jgi:hypothetical protein
MLPMMIARVQSAVQFLAKELRTCGGRITDGTSSLSFSPMPSGFAREAIKKLKVPNELAG